MLCQGHQTSQSKAWSQQQSDASAELQESSCCIQTLPNPSEGLAGLFRSVNVAQTLPPWCQNSFSGYLRLFRRVPLGGTEELRWALWWPETPPPGQTCINRKKTNLSPFRTQTSLDSLCWPRQSSCSWGLSLPFWLNGVHGCHPERNGPLRQIFCKIRSKELGNCYNLWIIIWNGCAFHNNRISQNIKWY